MTYGNCKQIYGPPIEFILEYVCDHHPLFSLMFEKLKLDIDSTLSFTFALSKFSTCVHIMFCFTINRADELRL
jgi:hypothetical protein